MLGCQECLVLFNHSSLVHNDSLELTVDHVSSAGNTNCSDNTGKLLDDAPFKLILVPHECSELLLGESLHLLQIKTKKLSHSLVYSELSLPDLIDRVGVFDQCQLTGSTCLMKIHFLFSDLDNTRVL